MISSQETAEPFHMPPEFEQSDWLIVLHDVPMQQAPSVQAD